MDINSSGIYKIINNLTGDIYVGSAVKIVNRWRVHKCQLNNNKHNNRYLQRVFNKYDNVFTYEVLENCNTKLLIEREQHYIDTLHPKYNLCPVAGNTLGYKPTPDQILRQTLARTYHTTKVYCTDKRFNLLSVYDSIKEASQETGKIREQIAECMAAKKSSIGNAVFMYEAEFDRGRFREDRVFKTRPFRIESKDSEVIGAFSNPKEACYIEGLNEKKIRRYLNGESKHPGGLIFIYE